jgi:O-antigen/teichoic acid export membrane protein
MVGLGVFAGLLLALITPWGVSSIQGVPDTEEAKRAMYAMAWAMPFIVLTSGLRGMLESVHAFGAINLIRLPMGLFTFLGPLAVVSYGISSLDWIAWILVIGRITACLIHFAVVLHKVPMLPGKISFKINLLRPLCISGGWMTVSNVISPLMGYVDRLLIGVLISTSAVAYYTTPQEIVTKLGIVPGALTAALFPRFAAHFVQHDPTFKTTYNRSVLLLAAILFVPVLMLTVWSNLILSTWISPDFAAHSAPVLTVLGWGMFVACLATIPFTVIQSAGNSRLTALLHMIEFPIFLVMLVIFASIWGLVGVAAAWVIRNVLDAVLLFYYAERYMTFSSTPH